MNKKQDPTMWGKNLRFSFKGIHRSKVKGWEKLVHKNDNHERSGTATFIAEEIDFLPKRVTKYKEGH